MKRCLKTVTAALAMTLPLLAPMAHAQADRAIPVPIKSLRGEVVFGQPPEVTLNGQPARLAPGSRIKGTDNMLVMSGKLIGEKLTVNYTVDTYGLLMDIWLLREEELAKPWPATPQQSAAWSYDPIQHTWIKP
jgi:hypothetical protein